MNRALLLLLLVFTLQLFGKVISPEVWSDEQTAAPVSKKILAASRPEKIRPSTIVMDTVPPVINCPASMGISLQTQGACDTVLHYTVTATDNQGPAIVIQLSGLPSGSNFPIGISICVFLATDLAGNTATCSFTITVQDDGVSIPVCKDLTTIYLGANCNKALLPEEALEGGPYGCWNRYITEVDKTIPVGNGPWVSALFGQADIGKTYQDRVTDLITGNKCWGNVKILDKTPPVFLCKDITISCSEENLTPDFLKDSLGIAEAKPQVSDACGNLSFLGFVDSQVLLDCDSPFTAIVNRVWQANDLSGNSSTCIQRIKRHRHTVAEMQMPPDITLAAPNINTNPLLTGQPFLIYEGRRYDMQNSSICDISAFYSDNILPLPCGDKRVRRQWELFDFCSGNTTGPFIQNIYLLDQTGPFFTCPADLTVSLNADTCHALADLPDVILDDASSQVASFQAFWENNGLAKTLIGSLVNFPGNNPAGHDTLGVLGLALLKVGTTTVSYVSEDSCGNTGDCTFKMTVADMVPPVVHCDSVASFALPEDGLLAVGASALDDGSLDACTPVSFKARLLEETTCLYDTVFSDSLRFCCLNLNDTLLATLRVYDVPVPFGNVTTSFGNGHYSDCAVKIIVTDPHPPLCTAPANVTVNCEDFDPTLELYGDITSTSCSVDSIAWEVDYSQFDSLCKKGTLTRIFKVYDSAGNIGGCAQAVKVDYLQDYFTKFPDDVIVTVCDPMNDYGEPVFFGQNCERFNVIFTDEIFNVVPDACYKIERTWKVTNTCSYNPAKPLVTIPNPSPNPLPNHANNLPGPIISACNTTGLWAPTIVRINPSDPSPTPYCTFWSDTANGYVYKQIIKVIDGQAPTGTYNIPDCSNQNWSTSNNPQLWSESFWWDNSIQTHDLSEEPTDLSIVATDACSGANVTVAFQLFLDLDGDGVMETVIKSESLGANGIGWNNVPFNNVNTPNYNGGTPRAFDERPVAANQKVGFAMEETVSGLNKTVRIRWNTQSQPNTYFPPELPHGTHKIKWFITDGCGNQKQYEYTFTVKDCKKPTVVCLAPLSVNMVGAGSITLYASDFLQYTEDNCTPADQIKIGIRKCGTGSGFPVDALGNPIPSVNFTCNELGNQCVEIWAIDKAGNAEYCETSVIVQDNQGNCSSNGIDITGRVITDQGAGIEGVSINVNGTCNFCPPFTYANITDSLGYYHLSNNVPIASNFTISPEKDDNPLNGVTTYDLVLISKHILGIEPLNSPYKMISADANKSGSVTTFDMVELRKLILGIYTDLPNNTSWRFVDSSFVFPNPQNPFQTAFPETISFSNVISNKHANFIGMKIGDVNNTALPSVLAPAQERFAGTTYFNTEDRRVQEGEVFELGFSSSEWLEGCQFTLETHGLEVLEILPGENMNKENFAWFPQKSLLTMSWEAGGPARFTLKLKAKNAGNLQDMLRFSDQITAAEAYLSQQSSISKSRLALRFGNAKAAFELFQNQPNPFSNKTEIRFQLPEAGPATLKILDSTGKLLWIKKGDFSAGVNALEIDLTGIAKSGVLYYQLETPEKSAVRKMVRI